MAAKPIVTDTVSMIAGMSPKLQPGKWIFETLDSGTSLPPNAIASFREPEGLSAILPAKNDAQHVMAWITLEVYSSLEGVGLTATVSQALAAASIPCNIVAATHHDHLFVPEGSAASALQILKDISSKASK